MKISIRYKIFWCFSLLILAAFIVMNLVVSNVIQRNNEAVISKELARESKNADAYAKQFLMVNSLKPDRAAFADKSTELLAELEQKLNLRGELYAIDGQQLGIEALNDPIQYSMDKDMEYGMKRKLAYTVSLRGNEANVCVSAPMIVDGEFLGILHYSRDYTELYKSGYYLRSILTASLFIILLFMFPASFFISNSITRPVSSLSSMAKDMAEGVFSGGEVITSNDEIGELAASFNNMREQIHENIKVIEKDRMLLKELDSYRKKFFDNVAHEFKTPLTTIRGYAQVMQQDGFNDKEFCEKGINHIEEESARLYRMVQSLLAVSRQASNNLEALFAEVDISRLLAGTCEEMRLIAGSRGMAIECDIVANILAEGYADDLKSAFANVLDNAIKYGNEGSSIKVECSKRDDFTWITVRNEGKGIPQNQMERVFDPFFRIYNPSGNFRGGSGLGLSIVKAVMEKHKGAVEMESIENAYTTVTLKLPVKYLQF